MARNASPPVQAGTCCAMGHSRAVSIRAQAPFYDELVDGDGRPREHCATLVDALQRVGHVGLAAAGLRRDAIFMQQGITFDATGEDGPVKDRPFPLDLVPRVIPADEWAGI